MKPVDTALLKGKYNFCHEKHNNMKITLVERWGFF